MRIWGNLNLTKYHESYFTPDLMFHNVWRVCLQHNGYSSHPPNHYTSTIISFFQYASHWAPLYKEQIRNYMSCSFLAKMANFILSTNTTRNRLNAYVVIKLSKLKLRKPKRKKKPTLNSTFNFWTDSLWGLYNQKEFIVRKWRWFISSC